MKVAKYKGKNYMLNEFISEVYEVKPNGKIVKKRNSTEWENKLSRYWTKQHNVLANDNINQGTWARKRKIVAKKKIIRRK
jgi:hypothetical protein